MFIVDLHTHSTFSDGTLTPLQLVKRAKKKRVNLLSLTDHDTVDGLPEFLECCRKEGVKGLTGVELSAEFPTTMHILGYRIDYMNPHLSERLIELRKHRDERNRRIYEKLLAAGLKLDFQEIEEESGGNVVARPHFARVLVRKGYSPDLSTAFRKFLARGALAYVPRVRLSPRESIQLILHAGGLPVLAHPLQTSEREEELASILEELKGYGLWGMECIYSGYSSQQVMSNMKLAAGMNLFCTAGTDFHGENRHEVDLGIRVAEDLLPWARMGVAF
ncbi:MAG TPA: PHP domain-containing protein [Synergistales bacterium]|nr:PHP domain-containing protein [Synergistales bacterium]